MQNSYCDPRNSLNQPSLTMHKHNSRVHVLFILKLVNKIAHWLAKAGMLDIIQVLLYDCNPSCNLLTLPS